MGLFRDWVIAEMAGCTVPVVNVSEGVIGKLLNIANLTSSVNDAELVPYTNQLSSISERGMIGLDGQKVGAFVGKLGDLMFFFVKKRGAWAEQVSFGQYHLVLLYENIRSIRPEMMVELLLHEYIHYQQGGDDQMALNRATRLSSKSEFDAHVGAFFNMVKFLASDDNAILQFMVNILKGNWSGSVYATSNNPHFNELRNLLATGDNFDKFADIVEIVATCLSQYGTMPRFVG